MAGPAYVRPFLWRNCNIGRHRKAAKNIRSIVFLDAFVPENGQCHMDLFPLEYAQLMRQDAQEWAKTMLVKHPLACFEQKLTLTGSCQRVARRTYILATGWPFAKFARRFDQDLTWDVKRVDCVTLPHARQTFFVHGGVLGPRTRRMGCGACAS